MSELGDALSKLVELKRTTDGGLWAAPSRRTIYCNSWKRCNFNAIGLPFARVQNHLNELDF